MITYSVSGAIDYDGFLPEEVVVHDNEISGTLGRRQANTRTWAHAPHVELANMRLPASPKVLTGFLLQFGAFDVTVSYREGMRGAGIDGIVGPITPSRPASEMIDMGHAELVKQEFRLTLKDLADAQTTIRMAWRGDRTTFTILERAINRNAFLVASPVGYGNDLLTTRDLWAFICYVFLLDYEEGRAKICGFRDCSTPYFVKQRKDQEYCSHRCAVNDNNLRRAQASKSKRRRRTR